MFCLSLTASKLYFVNFFNKLTNPNSPSSSINNFPELLTRSKSGKTNLLEAISLFSPGRGLRGTANQDLINIEENINSFEIKIILKYKTGSVTLYKKFANFEKKESYYLVDGELYYCSYGFAVKDW